MDDLGDFFSMIGGEKKKEKEKTKEIIGEVSLGDLFTSLNDEKKRAKQKLEEKEEKRKKDAKIFENLFFDKPQEPVKTDDWKQNYTPTEIESVDIISPEPLQPSPGAEKFEEEIAELEQEEQQQEKLSENVERWKDNLDILVPKEEQITEEEDSLNRLTREVDMLRKMLYQTIQKVEVQGGGGEVNLQFLDDVDRDSVLVNGAFLQYDAKAGVWTGSTEGPQNTGGGGSVDLGPLTNIAAASTGSITNGMSLEFDAASGQFIATVGTYATAFNGIAITTATPPNDGVLTFDNTTNTYIFKTPFNIVDLGDGIQDGRIDYGEFE